MADADVSEKVNAALQERARQQHHVQWGDFVNKYALNLLFPATVLSSSSSSSNKDKTKKLKTNKDLVNARLLENGILFEDLQTLPQLQVGVAQVVDNLMRTGCFESVQLKVDKAPLSSSEEEEPSHSHSQAAPQQSLQVLLDEKNWYSLYIGGGFKHEGLEEGMNAPTKLPKAQFECSATFPNLTGYLDQTLLKYTVDQTSTSNVLLSHERPLYAWLKDDSPLAEYLVALPKGSQYSLGVRAVLDTVDYEWTRSYQEYQRLVTCRLDNSGRTMRPDMAPGYYWGFDWSLHHRDVVPRKHASLPYAADASPEIVALSGPSITHSLTWDVRSNGESLDNRFQPTAGMDWFTKVQVAGPPGDVGFAKAQGGAALHLPLVGSGLLALHGTCAGGFLQPLDYNGVCSKPATISDRFFVGGPMSLRGFLPGGIGPRSSSTTTSSTSTSTSKSAGVSPGGDALGGTMYYTASLAASVAPPGLLRDYGVRVFSFVNAGTLVGTTEGVPLQTILNSTRTAVGAGISAATPMGRLEATYAWPLRYGPRDARRNFQFGFGFNYG
jgi:outer membrane protein assembly factor BamA